jgi:hypothetical protein
MDDWQLETLVAALLAGPRAPDIVDKFEYILGRIRARGGVRAIHEKSGSATANRGGNKAAHVGLTQKF